MGTPRIVGGGGNQTRPKKAKHKEKAWGVRKPERESPHGQIGENPR